jgi:hypothetical protein
MRCGKWRPASRSPICAGSSGTARRASTSGRSATGTWGLTEIKELRQLRDENARLKRVVADLTLDKRILAEVVRKKLAGRLPKKWGTEFFSFAVPHF